MPANLSKAASGPQEMHLRAHSELPLSSIGASVDGEETVKQARGGILKEVLQVVVTHPLGRGVTSYTI